jgi:CubicO group peptidase (beta-lactamase class C family)
MKMKKIGLTVLALFLLWPAAPAQEVPAQAVSAQAALLQVAPPQVESFDKARLDAYFDALEAADRFRGSVALSLNGEVIYSRTVGNSAKNSKYRIGSISKTFTTVLVMKAFEQGKLAPDQTIDAFFPSVPNAGKITIRHLLSHRSGIHNFTDDPDYLTWNAESRTESQMVALIAARGSDFEPGTGVRYSNSNFVLLTYILEKPSRHLMRNCCKNSLPAAGPEQYVYGRPHRFISERVSVLPLPGRMDRDAADASVYSHGSRQCGFQSRGSECICPCLVFRPVG